MKNYFPQLDGLRALAATMVLIHHYWPASIRIDRSKGRLGVDLFFVLSGFLITRSLARRQLLMPNRFKDILLGFYRNRFLRIVPFYYLTLLLACWLPSERTVSLVWHFCFLSNIYFVIHQQFIGAGGHLWALSIEQQFYLLWPFVFINTSTNKPSRAALWMVLGGLLFRCIALYQEWPMLTSDVFTTSALESLGCGALLAGWMQGREDRPDRWNPWLLILGSAGFVLWLPHLFLSEQSVLGHVVFLLTTELSRSLLLAWLVAQAVWGIPGWVGDLLQATLVRTLGLWSYGIYLSHNFFLGILRRTPHYIGPLSLYESQAFLALIATLLWAAGGYYLLEKPMTGFAKSAIVQTTL